MKPTAETFSSNPSSSLQKSAALCLVDLEAAVAAAAVRVAGGCAAPQGSPPLACGRENEHSVGESCAATAAAAMPPLPSCTRQLPPLDELPTLADRATAASSVSSKSSSNSSSSSRSSCSSSRRGSSSRSSSSGRPLRECGEEVDPLAPSPLLQTLKSWDEAYCPPAPKLKPQAAPLDWLMQELLEDPHLLPSLTEAAAAEACDPQQQLLGSGSAAAPCESLLPPDWGTLPQQWGLMSVSNTPSQQLVEAIANWSLRA
ncbi:hypothetical protein Esti_006488 [Eimeria stiedai]